MLLRVVSIPRVAISVGSTIDGASSNHHSFALEEHMGQVPGARVKTAPHPVFCVVANLLVSSGDQSVVRYVGHPTPLLLGEVVQHCSQFARSPAQADFWQQVGLSCIACT
jgi:hypothetical protein